MKKRQIVTLCNSNWFFFPQKFLCLNKLNIFPLKQLSLVPWKLELSGVYWSSLRWLYFSLYLFQNNVNSCLIKLQLQIQLPPFLRKILTPRIILITYTGLNHNSSKFFFFTCTHNLLPVLFKAFYLIRFSPLNKKIPQLMPIFHRCSIFMEYYFEHHKRVDKSKLFLV